MNEFGAVSVHTRSVDDAVAIGAGVYHPHVLRLRDRGEGFGMHLRASPIGPIVIGALEYRTPVSIRAAEFLDSYQVNLPLYGDVLMSYAGREHRATTRQAVVHGPAAPSRVDGWRTPARLLAVKVQSAHLENALASILGHSIQRPIGFHGAVDVTSAAGREWAALARRLDWWARFREEDDPLVGPTLTDAVVRGLLRAGRHEYTSELDDALASDPDAAVHRVLSLMHRRAASGASIGDIAEEAGVGLRTLEKRFQSRWAHTPSGMLRDIRLAYARRNLRHPESAELLVADVAARWGLPHPGRFAARYAERFGESPSTTLFRAAGARARAAGAIAVGA